MKKLFLVLINLLQIVPLLAVGRVNSQSIQCDNGLEQRLELNAMGRVIPEPPRAVNVRQTPGGDRVDQIQSGMQFIVINGPECQDGYSWWQIEDQNGLIGWIVEGTDAYFVEPLIAPSSESQFNETQVSNIIFRYDFSSNQYNWETAQSNNLTSNLIEGKYVIGFNSSHQSGYWVVSPGYGNWANAPVLDESYEVSFEISSLRSSTQSFNIAILFDVGEGYFPFKRLVFNNNSWELIRWSGEREVLAVGQISGEIDLLNGTSHLISLEVTPTTYTLHVDEQIVLVTSSVGPISGTIGLGLDRGLIANTEVYVEFDNLIVRTLPNQSATLSNLPVHITNQDCTTAPPTHLKLGEQAKLTIPADEIEWYYGHPLIDDGLFSLSSLENTILDVQDRAIIREDIQSFERSELLIIEGPICFNGQYIWKVASPDESRSYGRGTLSDIIPPDLSNLSFWVAETIESKQQLILSSTQPISGPPTYIPTAFILKRIESAPILFPEGQVSYQSGGNGYSRPFYWLLPSDCRVSESMHKVMFYEDRCLYIYPIIGDSPINIELYQPDGSVYSTERLTPIKIQIEAQTGGDAYTTFEVNAIRVHLPDDLGLQTGIWRVNAYTENVILSRTYQLSSQNVNSDSRLGELASFGGFWQYCDNPKPILVLTDFEPNIPLDVVLVKGRSEENNYNTFGELIGDFQEIYRWRVHTGMHGEMIMWTDFVPPVGYFVLTPPDEDWNNYLSWIRSEENYRNLSQPSRWACEPYTSRDEAQSALISYGDIVSGSLSEESPENYYTFYGNQGDIVTINVVNINDSNPADPLDKNAVFLDPFLQLENSDRYVLIENDNADSPQYGLTDSEIRNFILPQDGLYTIIVTYKGNSGSYILTIGGQV